MLLGYTSLYGCVFFFQTVLMTRVVISKSVVYSETISVPYQPRPSNYVDSSPSNSSSSPSISTPWVTYGLGFAAVILSIAAALTLVLVMKHIQTKRRQENKSKIFSLLSALIYLQVKVAAHAAHVHACPYMVLYVHTWSCPYMVLYVMFIFFFSRLEGELS